MKTQPHTSTTQKLILLSGVQPSNELTLGNYLGAIKNWTKLQKDYDCLFCIVDLHAITVKHDPKKLTEASLATTALYLSAGIDPLKNIIFVQSQVPQHAELAWILGCYTPMGDLSRMTQFKDKSQKQKSITTGLFTYPLLMAADVLLYQTRLVPVGLDQKQHLELTRDIAQRMNQLYGPLFAIPEIYIPPRGAKIMSLSDPTSKMSKSDTDPHATLFLFDSDDVISKKIKRAVTDSGTEITYDEKKPGIKNLIEIQASILEKSIESIVDSYRGKQYGHLKMDTADIVVACVHPIRQKALEFLKDKTELMRILQNGATQAKARAQTTLSHVYRALGFVTH